MEKPEGRSLQTQFKTLSGHEEQNQEPSEQIYNFLRKSSKYKNIWKRNQEDDENNEEDEGQVFNPKKKHVPQDNDQARAPIFQFEFSKEFQVQNDSRATATLETETDYSRDARAIRERVLKQADEALKGKKKGLGEEKLYKGIHAYTDYKAGFRREQIVASEKAGWSHGPLRASAHIRVSARFDYQPDICKDYKETGYCGYGDSCKFMHDRGDYKSGWQMEKEWDEAEKMRKRNLAIKEFDDEEAEADESDDDDSLPFA